MKNINRDYLVTVDVKTAKMTPAPKELKFFTTDVLTSNIFFRLEGLDKLIDTPANDEVDKEINDSIGEHFKENTDLYTLTLRVVKPNNEPKTIEVVRLDQGTNIYIADLTVDFVDIPGIYECELFIDTTINERQERSTTNPFEYEVKKSIFYNLDDIVDTKYISIEDIATIDYVNSLAVGGVSLEGYATDEDMNTKADKEHVHDDYVTQTQFDDTIRGIDCANINLENFVASNSISIKRKEYSPVGQYSTAEGYETTASGDGSHAEGSNTTASSYYSHAEGDSTVASGDTSHAEGYHTLAGGAYSHAEGYYTAARSAYQHVQGKYNIKDTDRVYAHIVGNGTDEDNRSNAHTLDWEGNAWFAGDVKVGADNKALATKDYVDSVSGSYDDTELRKLINNKADKNNSKLYGSVSIGNDCVADKVYTVAIGEGAYCGSMNQIAMGSWNVIDEGSEYAFIFGDGDYYDDEERRSNCMTIDRSGNCWHKGNIYVGSSSHDRYSKKVLTEGDIYFDNSGYLVVNINGTTKRFAPVG